MYVKINLSDCHLLTLLTRAPCLRRTSTSSGLFKFTATCSGVQPVNRYRFRIVQKRSEISTSTCIHFTDKGTGIWWISLQINYKVSVQKHVQYPFFKLHVLVLHVYCSLLKLRYRYMFKLSYRYRYS